MALHPALVMARHAREIRASVGDDLLVPPTPHRDPEVERAIDAARDRIARAQQMRARGVAPTQTSLDLNA